MNGPYRFTENRASMPTLEWERLPVVGGDRQRSRAKVLRRLLVALAAFWLAIIWAVIGALM
jgi:hypothetical protein